MDYAGGRPWDRELVEGFGANLLEPEFAERLGPYPITVDASARHAGLACALRSTEPEGICTSIGIYYEPETPGSAARDVHEGGSLPHRAGFMLAR